MALEIEAVYCRGLYWSSLAGHARWENEHILQRLVSTESAHYAHTMCRNMLQSGVHLYIGCISNVLLEDIYVYSGELRGG